MKSRLLLYSLTALAFAGCLDRKTGGSDGSASKGDTGLAPSSDSPSADAKTSSVDTAVPESESPFPRTRIFLTRPSRMFCLSGRTLQWPKLVVQAVVLVVAAERPEQAVSRAPVENPQAVQLAAAEQSARAARRRAAV